MSQSEVKQPEQKQGEQQKEEQKQEQKPEVQQSKVKEMRRIAERTEAPTDKSELITYLSERITQAEDALADTQQLLEMEVSEREKITKAIEDRNKQLQSLYKIDQKSLPDKIKDQLTQILTSTVTQKMEAEELLKVENQKNYEYKAMYQELKWQQKQFNLKLEEQQERQQTLNEEIGKYEAENSNYEREIQQLTLNFTNIKQKKENVEGKYFQMKVALERMNDIKAVMNRFFGNEDLFDQKMELKEQQVRRVEVNLNRQNHPRLPSREMKNTTKLKPITQAAKNNHDDEDFWRGDFSKK